MSTERRAAALVTALLLWLLWPGGAAHAQTDPAGPSPAETIAAALREQPVYVDPSLRSLLDEDAQAALAERIAATGEEIYVVVVPLVRGDAWDGDPAQLVGAVSDRLGGSASYLVLEDNDLWLHGEGASAGDDAFYAALTVNIAPESQGASLARRLDHAVDLIAGGRAVEEYERISAEREPPPPSAWGAAPSAWPWIAGTAVLAAVVVLSLVAARSRRAHPRPLAHTVFDSIDAAGQERMRRDLGARLTATGKRLAALTVPDSDAARAALQQALDAHLAAGKVLDAAADLPDLAGALVLLDLCDAHVDQAVAARSTPRPVRHCFFDPLHGTRTSTTPWRGLGTRRRVTVWACGDCATALRKHRQPEALPAVLDDGRRVPYYDLPPERSVWAATGYGTLHDDLVARVLRGDSGAAR